ncbi:MAG: serine/threonine-protein kinase, partial [Vicinamibacterales bacterium]
MDAADLATLSRLLDQALDRDPADRLPWVDALGPEYERLKPRLRHLLAEPLSFETDSLDTLPRFDVPADTTGPGAAPDRAGADRAGEEGPAPRWSADTARPEPGALVGPYRLVRLLAEGGMGSVWLGERADGLVKRPVAIKLPQGAWRRAGLAERMARERDILASLTHPHIARLYDAGLTADGQPFLALEHVDGRPIDEYCRAASLDVRARVALFLQVARAVAYAHGRLVVHRDLKPSNILVTADGQVRLLDFGVAKMLDEQMAESTVTAIAGAAFTPAYASPEQMDGSATGVGSDVYSLGVVLFELLTGRRPHQPEERSFRTLAAALASDAPVPLASGLTGDASARRALRGDLDTILSKALKKSVTERYATVDALAEDLSRYLEGRPVLARPDSTSYILAKIVRRHALAVAAAAAVLVAIVAGAGVALWQMQVARAEQQRAEAVKEFVASIFREANPYEAPGTVPTAPALLRQARERIDQQFTGRPALRVELLNIVSSSLMQLMDVDSAEPIALDAVTSARRQLGERDLHTLRSRVLWMQVNRHRGRTREMRAEIDALAQDLR